MKDYASIILGNHPDKKSQKPLKDYASILLSPDPKVVGLQQQDTLTPNLDQMDVRESPSAPFSALYRANMASDPQTRLRMIADAVMPDLEDRMDRIAEIDGEIVYMPEEGKLYQATPRGWGKIKDWVADLTTPSGIGAAIGSVGGPEGAALGAAAGKGYERAYMALGEDEPQTTSGNIRDMALAGAGAYVGERIGRFLGNRHAAKQANKIANDPDMALSLDDEANALIKYAKEKFGLTLLPSESTGSGKMLTRQRVAANADDGASQKLGNFLNNQRPAEFRNSIGKISKELGLPDDTGPNLKTRAHEKAIEIKDNLLKRRENAASKYYQAASNNDISERQFQTIKNFFTNQLKDVASGSDTAKYINKQMSKLYETGRALDGGEIRLPVTNIGKLHGIKTEIDKLLDIDPGASADKILNAKLVRIKNGIVNVLKASDTNYRRGNAEFIRMSKPVDSFNKSLIGKIARAKSDDDVAKIIFSGNHKQISEAKKLFDKENWNGVLRAKIEDVFDSVNTDKTKGAFQFADKILGKQVNKANWAVALGPERYKVFKTYLEVLDKFRMASAGYSPTQPLQQETKAMTRQANRGIGKVRSVGKLAQPAEMIKNAVNANEEKKLGAYAAKYMDALLDGDPKVELAKLKRLQVESVKAPDWVPRAAAVLGVSSTNGVEKQLPE